MNVVIHECSTLILHVDIPLMSFVLLLSLNNPGIITTDDEWKHLHGIMGIDLFLLFNYLFYAVFEPLSSSLFYHQVSLCCQLSAPTRDQNYSLSQSSRVGTKTEETSGKTKESSTCCLLEYCISQM